MEKGLKCHVMLLRIYSYNSVYRYIIQGNTDEKKGTCVRMCVSLCVTAKLNEYDTFDCIGNAMFVLLNMLSLVLSFPALR